MKRLLASVALVSVMVWAQPVAAVNVITPGAAPPASFIVTGNPFTGTNVVTASIGDTPNVGGTTASPASFTDDFQFTIGPPGGGLIGTGSGSISTSTSLLLSATDLDILSVMVNGTPVGILRSCAPALTCPTATDGLLEFSGTSSVQIFSGVLNHITISGLSRGAGSYGGNLTFLPAVPEPATWAMMLLGFAGIGLTVRRKTRIAQLA